MKTIFTIIAILCCASVFSQSGSLDSSFATNGKFTLSNLAYQYYFGGTVATTIQKDGKILLAGYGNNYNQNTGQDFVVIRLNANGTLDNGFGNGGVTFIDFTVNSFSYTNDAAHSIALQSDGKIVVAGTASGYHFIDSTQTYNYSDIAVARLTSTGSLDNSFNGTGKAVIDLSAITSAGGSYRYSYDYGNAVTVKPNGKIVVAGTAEVYDAFNTSNFGVVVLQLNSNGTKDAAFANAGIEMVRSSNANTNNYVQAVTIQKDGNIVVCGSTYSSTSGASDVLAIRLKTNGTPDSTFNKSGILIFDLTNGSFDYSNAVIQQSNSKLLLSCAAGGTIAVVRLNTNGSFDKSFAATGKALVSRSDLFEVNGMALQADGKILQTGTEARYIGNSTVNFTGGNNFYALRHNADGTIDSSFGTRGFTIVDFGNYTDGYQDYNQACALQADGKLIAVGSNISQGFQCATRILTTGKNFGVTAPASQSDTAAQGNCTVTFSNIDPALSPDTSLSLVKYTRYNATSYPPLVTDSGYGSVSGKPFPIGNTVVTYSSTVDGLQRDVFSVNVSGGTPAGTLDFDGVNDLVFINSYLDPIASYGNGQYAFEAWIKVRKYSTDGSFIFGNERNNNSGIIVQLNNKGYITTYHPSVGYVVSKSKVALNKWTHIAFTQTNSSLDLYVNGKFVQTLLSAPYLHTSTYTSFYLGAYTDDDTNFSRFFNGEIDEAKVWGQAICGKQIQNNLHCEVDNNAQGLVAHFTFNQGLASCENQSVTILNGGGYVSGLLQNFALTGPTSNWVTGYISGSCVPFVPLSITNYPSSVNVQATGDSCGATVNFAVTYSSGCSANPTLTYSQNPGTYFPTGTTYVSATLQDSFGNSQNVYFPVTVTETVPPTLVLKDTSVMLNDYGYVYVNPYDLIDSLYDNCTPGYYLYPYVSGNTYLNCNNKGPNPITITVYDQSGNSTTKTAYVTIAPYVATATVAAIPNPQQYSDYATIIATLPAAQNLYYNGCLYGSQVTFKVGGKDAGTIVLSPDGYGNLTGAVSYKLTDIFPKKITATFSNVDSTIYKLSSNTVATTLNGAPENATVDYIESQLINTSTNKVTIPVSVQLTDSADGSRGDIRKSIVTFLIQPITPGATVTGSNTVTVSSLEFISSDKTSGIARGNFTVNLGRNTTAKFNVIATVGNYYTGSTTAVVYVSKSGGSVIVNDNKTSSNDGIKSLENSDFGVTVLPNPSRSEFSLQVNSSQALEKVNIRISDAVGRVIETFSNVGVGDVVKLGGNYTAGTYMAEISQGNNRKSYKLIKL